MSRFHWVVRRPRLLALLVALGICLGAAPFLLRRWLILTAPRTVQPGNYAAVRHAYFLARNREARPQIVFLGDSITAGFLDQQVWQSRLVPLGAVNYAIVGETVEQIRARAEDGELARIRPRVIVVMAGTNDLEDPPAEIAARVTQLVASVRRLQPQTQVILCSLLPCRTDSGGKVREVNRRLHRIPGVTFLDLSTRFQADPGRLLADGVHPSPAGYRVWAEALLPLLTAPTRSPGDHPPPRSPTAPGPR